MNHPPMTSGMILRPQIGLGVDISRSSIISLVSPAVSTGRLPRNNEGKLIVLEHIRKLTTESHVKLNCVRVPYFPGMDPLDITEMVNCFRDLNLFVHFVFFVGSAGVRANQSRKDIDEDDIVEMLAEGLKTAIRHRVEHVVLPMTSIEAWTNEESNDTVKENDDDEAFVASLTRKVNICTRACEIAAVNESCIQSWQIVPGTTNRMEQAWKFVKEANKVLGRNMFRVQVNTTIESTKDDDSPSLDIPGAIGMIKEIAKSEELGSIVDYTSREKLMSTGCLSKDDNSEIHDFLLSTCAETGKLEYAFVGEDDQSLEAVRNLDPEQDVDTFEACDNNQAMLESINNMTHRLNNLVTQGVLEASPEHPTVASKPMTNEEPEHQNTGTLMSILRFFLRPSLWVAILSVYMYWDATALRGEYVYDDAGSVSRNVLVRGDVPWIEVVTRDFWGTPMEKPSSHKSYRPITTLTFRLNHILAERMGVIDTADETFGFHVGNVVLHGVVVGLLTESCSFIFDGGTRADTIAQIITGLLFGLHPLHAEAVSNITSRGELLMSMFFFLAFLSYASHIPTSRRVCKPPGKLRYFFAIYVAPFIFLSLSMFSKEQGATTLVSLVAFDFLNNMSSVQEFFRAVRRKERSAIQFLRRTIVLAIQTIALCGLRMWLNGESSPDFVYDQNPAGFSEDRFTRVMSVNWVYCLYIYDAIFPKYLCCDWSGKGIDLIESPIDVRILGVLALWLFFLWSCRALIVAVRGNAKPVQKECRRIVLMAFYPFLFGPFLLSSNLLVVTGLMKADRVVYLPLFGFCLMEALLFKVLFCESESQREGEDEKANTMHSRKSAGALVGVNWLGHIIIMIQLVLFGAKLHERNLAWSSNASLWLSAYEINKRSYNTIYNCGYHLSLEQKYEEAEKVLRPIADPHVKGPPNTFVYVMVLRNLGRCDEARPYIEKALEMNEEQEKDDSNVRNRKENIFRVRSNLLVAKALCTNDIGEMGRTMYRAVQVDPSNDYAVEQAKNLLKQVESAKRAQAGAIRRPQKQL